MGFSPLTGIWLAESIIREEQSPDVDMFQSPYGDLVSGKHTKENCTFNGRVSVPLRGFG